MIHVSRTHRVALDWLFDRINLDSKDPNQNMLIPKTNLPMSWRKAISPVMNRITISVCAISWTFQKNHLANSAQPAPLRQCRKGWCSKKDPEKTHKWLQNQMPMRSLVSKTVERSPTSASYSPGILKAKGRQWRETCTQRYKWKHSIEFSSVATRCKSELQCRDTCGRNDRESHWYKVVSPQFVDVSEQRRPSSKKSTQAHDEILVVN